MIYIYELATLYCMNSIFEKIMFCKILLYLSHDFAGIVVSGVNLIRIHWILVDYFILLFYLLLFSSATAELNGITQVYVCVAVC